MTWRADPDRPARNRLSRRPVLRSGRGGRHDRGTQHRRRHHRRGTGRGFLGYFYFKHAERPRRLEIIHAERLAAMDKGIPLPELPLDPVKRPPRLRIREPRSCTASCGRRSVSAP